MEHFAGVVDGLMSSALIFPNEHRTDRLGRCGQVEVQGLPDLWLYEQRRGSQVLFQIFEGLFALIRPRETVRLTQNLEEREAPFSRPGNESAKSKILPFSCWTSFLVFG